MRNLLGKYIKKALDRNTVKRAFDTLPEALCYFDGEGLTELCNLQMYRLCHQIMDSDIQTFAEFIQAFEAGAHRISDRSQAYVFPDGSVWKLSLKNVVTGDGRKHTEVILFNISNLYEKRMELLRQTGELEAVSEDIKALSENLQTITKEKEILAFKTRLHDQMGAGLIAIRRSLINGSGADEAAHDAPPGGADRELDEAVNIFQRAVMMTDKDPTCADAALHDMEAELFNMERDAAVMGAGMVTEGRLPAEAQAAEVFLIAMRECLTNGIRHAGATQIYVSMGQRDAAEDASRYYGVHSGGYYCLEIKNNGKRPEREIVPGGGLLNLNDHVRQAGGRMKIESWPEFALTVEIPVNTDGYGCDAMQEGKSPGGVEDHEIRSYS